MSGLGVCADSNCSIGQRYPEQVHYHPYGGQRAYRMLVKEDGSAHDPHESLVCTTTTLCNLARSTLGEKHNEMCDSYLAYRRMQVNDAGGTLVVCVFCRRDTPYPNRPHRCMADPMVREQEEARPLHNPDSWEGAEPGDDEPNMEPPHTCTVAPGELAEALVEYRPGALTIRPGVLYDLRLRGRFHLKGTEMVLGPADVLSIEEVEESIPIDTVFLADRGLYRYIGGPAPWLDVRTGSRSPQPPDGLVKLVPER